MKFVRWSIMSQDLKYFLTLSSWNRVLMRSWIQAWTNVTTFLLVTHIQLESVTYVYWLWNDKEMSVPERSQGWSKSGGHIAAWRLCPVCYNLLVICYHFYVYLSYTTTSRSTCHILPLQGLLVIYYQSNWPDSLYKKVMLMSEPVNLYSSTCFLKCPSSPPMTRKMGALNKI